MTNLQFFAATYRLFKLDELESACEDYGQSVIYRGSIRDYPNQLLLDKHHNIKIAEEFRLCGNTWKMLHDSRFAPPCC